MLLNILSWLFTGLFVGGMARLLIPGRQAIGLGATILLGIVGAMVGGFISLILFGPPPQAGNYDISLVGVGWIFAILGAVALLWSYLAVSRQNY